MLIERLNLNQIKVFECVFRVQSMTAAARELHLTQPGVSQHIKQLEDILGVKLFDRVQRRLLPTSSAKDLYRHSSLGLEEIEQGLLLARGELGTLGGTVAIGMPVEFGNNVAIPLLSRFSRKHPGVRFDLRTGFAYSMIDPLLSGELDFAFVDEFHLDRRIKITRVYDEVLELCAAPDLLKRSTVSKKDGREFFESLDYVDYQEGAPVLRKWLAQNLGDLNFKLRLKATVMDVQGVARLIESQMGAGILPGHLLVKLRKEGSGVRAISGGAKPVKNAISLAHLPTRSQSPAALALMEWIRAALLQA